VAVLPSLIALLLLPVLLAACTSNQTQVRSTGNAVDLSQRSEHVLRVPEEARTVRLHIEARVTEGAVTWTLLDPDGAVREEGTAIAGHSHEEELRFGPITGEWKLEVGFEGMTGSYDFRLRATW
jgi:hypothetical protein